jgi:hypothetical protein
MRRGSPARSPADAPGRALQPARDCCLGRSPGIGVNSVMTRAVTWAPCCGRSGAAPAGCSATRLSRTTGSSTSQRRGGCTPPGGWPIVIDRSAAGNVSRHGSVPVLSAKDVDHARAGTRPSSGRARARVGRQTADLTGCRHGEAAVRCGGHRQQRRRAHSGTGRGRVRVLEVDHPAAPDRIGAGDGRLVRRREADQLVGGRHRASATGPEVTSSGSATLAGRERRRRGDRDD